MVFHKGVKAPKDLKGFKGINNFKTITIMKKVLLTLVVAMVCSASAFAQFEEGKYYGSASATGLDLSFSESTDLAFGLNAAGGYFIKDNLMVLAEFGTDYRNSEFQQVYIGGKARYYLEENGLFLSGGCKLCHFWTDDNDFQITPEVGYCYFLNKTVTIEPSVYYDISLTDFGNYSKFGVKCAIGLYF